MYAHVSSPFDVVWPRFAATNPIVVYYNIVIMVLYIKKCPGRAWAGERVLLEKGYDIMVFCVMIRNALRHYVVLCCNIL